MQFTATIGFLALAGLIVPVLIHLWSVKQGKTLKIGSIAFLGENATTSSKSLKLTNLLLFALRCLLLMLIAFILAQPYLKDNRIAPKNKGWILMDKAQITAIYKGQRTTIDSLLLVGFELRDFNLGFNKFSLNDSTNAADVSSRLAYNSLLNQLNKEIPSGYSAYLFADRRLNNFDGKMPVLNFKLVWKDIDHNDTVKNWSTTFLGKVYNGKSTPSFTNYSSNESQNLPIVKVMIYDPMGIDSKYIKAALAAISDFTKRKIEIVKSSNKADVVFWLSDQPITLSDEQKIFSYQKGKKEAINSTIQCSTNAPDQIIELKQRIALDNLKGVAIWRDGYGQPVLIKEVKNNHFHFYSRFDPLWTDLVWDEQFVKALLPIVLGDPNDVEFGFEANDADQRLLAKTQFAGSKNNSVRSPMVSTTHNIDYLIWVLAFVVLIIERMISFRTKNINYAKS